MKKISIGWDEWMQAVQEMRSKKADTVPPDWVTAEQFAEQALKSKTDSHARKLLGDLWRSGKADRKKFLVASGDEQSMRRIYHYRLKK